MHPLLASAVLFFTLGAIKKWHKKKVKKEAKRYALEHGATFSDDAEEECCQSKKEGG